MKYSDSAAGQLVAAWMPKVHGNGSNSAAVFDMPRVRSRAPSRSQRASRSLVTVVVAADSRAECQEFSEVANGTAGEVARRMQNDSRFEFTSIAAARLTELEVHLRERVPRVLIVEATLLQGVDDESVRYLHRRVPAVYWMLMWKKPSAGGFEVALRSRARGAIAVDASAEHIGLALGAVLDGDLWFPRQVMHALYLALLAANFDISLSPVKSEALEDRRSRDCRLTPREAEALVLLREGLTNKQIGERLGVGLSTVKKHLEHAFRKRGLHNRRQTLG